MNSQQNITPLSGWKGGKITKIVGVILKPRGANKIQLDIEKDDTVIFRKTFEISDFMTDDITKEEARKNMKIAAEKMKYQKCKENGLLKNMYRSIKYEDDECIEVSIDDDFNMIVDTDCYDIISPYIWNTALGVARTAGKERRYVFATINKKKVYLSRYLGLKCGIINDESQMIDFINGNSLDLRLKNLRPDGRIRENISSGNNLANSNNSVEINMDGIKWQDDQKRWAYRWADSGKTKSKTFSMAKYKSKENALDAAKLFKKERLNGFIKN